MKDLIKEVAPFLIMKFWKRDQWNNEYFDGIGYSEALVEELSKRAEAVGYLNPNGGFLVASYMPQATGLERETHTIPAFTFPPIHDIEAIENRVAEACAKACIKEAVQIVIDGPEERAYNNATSDCAEAIKSGEWRKYK